MDFNIWGRKKDQCSNGKFGLFARRKKMVSYELIEISFLKIMVVDDDIDKYRDLRLFHQNALG